MGKVLYEFNKGVAVITFDAPPMNSLTRTMIAKLGQHLSACITDPKVRAIVLQGAGPRAFCAGSDIVELRQLMAAGSQALAEKFAADDAVFNELAHCPKPTVAAVEGAAIGGGLELAACCDFIIAGKTTRLALPEIRLGVFPGNGGTVRVTRRIGSARARQMMLLGDTIDASTAQAWGLVDDVTEGPAIDAALRIALRLSQGPAKALQGCKASIDAALRDEESEALHTARRWSIELGISHDAAEGMLAFLEKRQPNFTD